MLDGFRSRCTTSRWCAYSTAAHTCSNSATRAATVSDCRSHHAVIVCPSTYSMARKGRPSTVVPPSSRRAMCGCSNDARIWRSRWKRASTSSVSTPRRSTLMATRCSKAPSLRCPRYTVPMPPRPSSRSMRKRGTSGAFGGASSQSRVASRSSASRTTAVPPSSSGDGVSCARSRRCNCASSDGSAAHCARTNASRSATGRSSAALRMRSIVAQRPGSVSGRLTGASSRGRAPALGAAHQGTGSGASASSSCRYARARIQSRSTVRSETPRASAVSGALRPPKNRHSTTWTSRGSRAAS
jgi:hypothetical protein